MKQSVIHLWYLTLALATLTLLVACGGGGGVGTDSQGGDGLVDTLPPSVLAVYPPAGAAGVPLNSLASLVFSEGIDPATLTAASFTLQVGDTRVPGRVEYSAATRAATFIPDHSLAAATGYTLELAASVRDLAGNALAAPFTARMTTGAGQDLIPPAVVTVTPAANATEVPSTAPISVRFGEPMDPATFTGETFRVETAGGVPVAGRLTYDVSSSQLTFLPVSPLSLATAYTVTLAEGVTDMADNSLAAAYSWGFRTSDALSPPPPPSL